MSRRFLAKSPVGFLPPANLETAHSARRFRAPAQMRSRCVGRGAAGIGAKPRGTQRLAKFAPLRRERGVYRARRCHGVRLKADTVTEGVNAGAPRPCRTKKERQPWRSCFRAPAKIAKRVLWDNFRAPAKIAKRVLWEKETQAQKKTA